MKTLGIDFNVLKSCFEKKEDHPFTFICVSAEDTARWADLLAIPLRRCYISDETLAENAQRTGHTKYEILAAKLPDHGSTMSGDFGEIVVYLYHASQLLPATIIGPKKWQLKQDRTKPAPYSDVVHFVLPSWPQSSENDLLLCSEVKTKSTNGSSMPIKEAIVGCEKDRNNRLAKTLVWLYERALNEDLGTTSIDHLKRFINATDHAPARKKFYAVAVICSSLTESELLTVPNETKSEYELVVISIPALKTLYEKVYKTTHDTVLDSQGEE